MGEHVRSAPTVSAIIVVLDGEVFIRDAIESVLSQTFTEWELIVVDDGSTDGTANIVRDYQRKLPGRVRLITHLDGGNHGIAASRNLGLKVSRGTFIGFLDADDVWMPEKLAEQTVILAADASLGMTYGRSLIWNSWNGSHKNDFYYPLGVQPDARHDPPILFEVLLQNKAQTPTICNALIRASLFETLGGFENTFRLMFEDLTFFAKALAFTPVFVSNRTWAKYRQHPMSCSAISASKGEDSAARLTFLRWLNGSMSGLRPSLRVRVAVWRALAKAQIENVTRRARRRFRALR